MEVHFRKKFLTEVLFTNKPKYCLTIYIRWEKLSAEGQIIRPLIFLNEIKFGSLKKVHLKRGQVEQKS
jgi:hypothetical protein